ncbi:hypothetical protein B0J12DRAFT_702256 [Macrophomina phaseolina]|uniref:Uncharacterized protein n=1 Tax=Macrophomina phaseolina TaxID=35725 RepID=A0ABQ8G4P5_9PEZI|nr:hypothetical protein B0J12DRAFT_702256 [Macrophomina phaseolina]
MPYRTTFANPIFAAIPTEPALSSEQPYLPVLLAVISTFGIFVLLVLAVFIYHFMANFYSKSRRDPPGPDDPYGPSDNTPNPPSPCECTRCDPLCPCQPFCECPGGPGWPSSPFLQTGGHFSRRPVNLIGVVIAAASPGIAQAGCYDGPRSFDITEDQHQQQQQQWWQTQMYLQTLEQKIGLHEFAVEKLRADLRKNQDELRVVMRGEADELRAFIRKAVAGVVEADGAVDDGVSVGDSISYASRCDADSLEDDEPHFHAFGKGCDLLTGQPGGYRIPRPSSQPTGRCPLPETPPECRMKSGGGARIGSACKPFS